MTESDDASPMNIYDFAGNVWEWTLEYTANTDMPCAYRGGSYDNTNHDNPAASRSNGSTTLEHYSLGFRSALY